MTQGCHHTCSFTWPSRLDNDVDILMLTDMFFGGLFDREKFLKIDCL